MHNKLMPLVKVAAFATSYLVANAAIAQTNIIQLASPYRTDTHNEQQITDKSKDVLRCIFDKMQLSYAITEVPWLRAQRYLSTQTVAGVITTMPYREAEAHAVLSAPLALEKWSWYFEATDLLFDDTNKHQLNIGAISNSNQAIWLKAQGYQNLTLVETYQQLLILIEKKRIDAFIADQATLKPALQSALLSTLQSTLQSTQQSTRQTTILKNNYLKIKSKFLNYVPQGIYFSKAYLKDQPNLMQSFNENVSLCTPDVIELLAREKLLIKKKVLPKIYNWVQNPLISKTLNLQNLSNSKIAQSEILALDKRWIAEIHTGKYSVIQQLLDNPLSRFLQTKQKQSDHLYTELFITDRHGLNAAMSQPTSDYWQGDEKKYLQTLGLENGSIFIDDIKYDESTKKFQSQISIVINDLDKNTALGMLTVGVDVEKALLLEQ